MICLESIGQITQFRNWTLTDGELSWQKIFEKNDSVENLINYVSDIMKQDGAMNLVSSDQERMTFDMSRKIFEKRGDLYSARITVDFKDGRYRVTITDVIRFLGEKTLTRMAIWAGSNGNQFANGLPLEDNTVNKKRITIKSDSTSWLATIDEWFEDMMTKESATVKKDDW